MGYLEDVVYSEKRKHEIHSSVAPWAMQPTQQTMLIHCSLDHRDARIRTEAAVITHLLI